MTDGHLISGNLIDPEHPLAVSSAPAAGETTALAAAIAAALDGLGVVLGASTATIGKLGANSGVDIGDVDVKSLPPVDINEIAPYPLSPVDAVYTPSTTSYAKITPAPTLLHMEVRARTASDDLIRASILTHKIADATTITSAAPTTDETDRLRATEFKGDNNVHMASLVYHDVVGPVITAADATDDPTLIALTLGINTALMTHAASATQHGGRADATFLAALTALALPASPTTAQCRAYLADAALKAAWDAHRAVTDGGIYVTIPAGSPDFWDCKGTVHYRTSTSGGTFTSTSFLSE